MEYINTYRFEVAIAALMKILLLFAALLALHISGLFYESGCPPCMMAGIKNRRIKALEGEPSSLVSAFDNAGIYAFSTRPSSALLVLRGSMSDDDSLRGGMSDNDALRGGMSDNGALRGGMSDDALKPLYNSNYLLNNGNLLISNAKLSKLWTSKEWRSKVSIFTNIFSDIMKKALLKPCVKALCIGAGKGHEVLALKEMGVHISIGIDLVASPPLVMKGDMHSQPFGKDTFDFEFSNVFDHALFTSMFAAEIERTLKPGGCVAIHLMLKNPKCHKSGNNLQDVDVLIALFRNFEVVHVGDIDAFGLDTEVIFRKPFLTKKTGLAK
eukprot:c3238_g1_i1 orf=102-1079(-)